MSSKKHADTAVDLNIPYEQNEIQLKGIFGFAIGLFLLIVVTFGLMWALLYKVMPGLGMNVGAESNPMAMSEREKLPPEPRLQLAPGFGVESEKGRVNMELVAPEAEYRELRRQWDQMLERGLKDEKSGVVTMMPIDTAKEKFLSQNVKARSGADAESFFVNARSFVSDSSAGRVASEMRR